jgi:hypothetical protein
MTNTKKSSSNMAGLASKTLRDNTASNIAKRLAGSVLAQRDGDKQTGAEMEDLASKVLHSEKYSDETKALAGSVVSQSVKER